MTLDAINNTVWHHTKTGGTYVVHSTATMQDSTTGVLDDVTVVVYQRVGSMDVFVRPLTEFSERFEQVIMG